MQFNSYVFILLFLPITVIIYFLINKINVTAGKLVLILSSILFYAYQRYEMLVYLVISIALNYALARAVRKCDKERRTISKAIITFAIILNIIALLYFKYLNFGIANINNILGTSIGLRSIILPLGISFYTFQQIAYMVSVYKGEINVGIVDYLVYILYFPKILMGPLVEPEDFYKQINDDKLKSFNTENIAFGLKVFSYGLLKKVLLADTFSAAVSWGYDHYETLTSSDLLLIMLFYTFEIYFDFSGYTDMAMGASQMLNIELPINFDSPYKALSIRDFWKRWHISLTKFFTKYLYIPLGGSRKGSLCTYVNTLIIFIVSGLWHGAQWTFVLWGILHGLFSVIDRMLEKAKIHIFEPFRWLLTFSVVNVLWLLFGSTSISQWEESLLRIIQMHSTSVTRGLMDSFEISECGFVFDFLHLNSLYYTINGFCMWIFIGVAAFICFVPQNTNTSRGKLNVISAFRTAIALSWGILCLGKASSFLYFGF